MPFTKGRLLIDGGEGYIYEVAEDPKLLMKIYKETDSLGEPVITPELIKKLQFMVENPPSVLIEKGIIAWPLELVYSGVSAAQEGGELKPSASADTVLPEDSPASVDHEGESERCVSGFVMPKLDMDEHLQRVYGYRHPQLDAAEYSKFPSVQSRISIAINLCAALHELHKVGYVVGDFNHRNIGVNYNTGQIYFVDCDSFHITDFQGNVYRSNVIMAGYLAPEIISHCSYERAEGRYYNLDKVSPPTFTKESDLFCLAIHIFKLLMNGVDPFRGVKSDATGSTASPFVGNDAIERDAYVFKPGNKPSAVFCPPVESVPPEIFSLFDKAFIQGKSDPGARPDAEKWYYALTRFLTNDLAQCPKDPKHQYYKQLPQCPYCAADHQHMAAQGTDYAASLPIRPVNLSSEPVLRQQAGQITQSGFPQQAAYGVQQSAGHQTGFSQQQGYPQQSSYMQPPYAQTAKKSKAGAIIAVVTAIALIAAVLVFIFVFDGLGANPPTDDETDVSQDLPTGNISQPETNEPTDTTGTPAPPTDNSPGAVPASPAPSPPAEVQSVTITYAYAEVRELQMEVGEQLQLRAIIAPAGAQADVIWSSSNTGVFEIIPADMGGAAAAIRAVGTGEAVLTATAGDAEQICYIRVSLSQPPEEPELPATDKLAEVINHSADWVRIIIHWTGTTGGPTVFERDKDSPVWIMLSRDGYWRILDPHFSISRNTINIGFPTSRSEYSLFDDMTGFFGSDSFYWEYETDPVFSRESGWGMYQSQGLGSAFSIYPLVAIYIYWNNGDASIFYLHDDGGWSVLARNGNFSMSAAPTINSQNNRVVLSFPNSTNQYTLLDGGSGTFGTESFTWGYSFYG